MGILLKIFYIKSYYKFSMLKEILKDVSIGLTFAGISYGVINIFSYGPTSFAVNSYLYVGLGLIIGLRHIVSTRFGGLKKALQNFVVVVEKEEVYLHRLVSGEKLKIEGKVERVQ